MRFLIVAFIPSGRMLGKYFKLGRDHFCVFTSSLFTKWPTVWCCMVLDFDIIFKQTTNWSLACIFHMLCCCISMWVVQLADFRNSLFWNCIESHYSFLLQFQTITIWSSCSVDVTIWFILVWGFMRMDQMMNTLWNTYEGWYESNASFSSSATIIIFVMKFAHIMCTSFTK